MKPSMIPRLCRVLNQRLESAQSNVQAEGHEFLNELLNLASVAEHNDLNMGDIFEQQIVRCLNLSTQPEDSHHKKAQAIRFMSGILPMERQAGVGIKLANFFKKALEKGAEEKLNDIEYEAYLDKIMAIYSHPGNHPEMSMMSLQLENELRVQSNASKDEKDLGQKLTQIINDCWAELNPGWSPNQKPKEQSQTWKI